MTGREQFELVWKGSGISGDDTLKQIAWAFWKASRETVEVALPPTFWYDHDDLPREVAVLNKQLVKKAIRAAGIKVKGE